jgi:hypothetical protein
MRVLIRQGDVRRWLLFLAGMAGVAHETVLAAGERPWLLALFGGMLGLPGVMAWDRRIRVRDGEPELPPDEPGPPPSPQSDSTRERPSG